MARGSWPVAPRGACESSARGGAQAAAHQLAHRQICDSSFCPSRAAARAPLGKKRGSVALVGAGPGDPDLLTVKALRLIQNAEVILHDDLVPQAILALASPRAEVVNVGKRCGTKTVTQEQINALMIEHARGERSVVRLKSGDPLIFGRAAEEMAALAEAGIQYEIVPRHHGSLCGGSVRRRVAYRSQCRIECNVFDRPSRAVAQPRAAAGDRGHNEGGLHARPRSSSAGGGVAAARLATGVPCAVVSRAAQPDQQVWHTTLADLGELPPAAAPSLLIAGWTVRRPEHASHAVNAEAHATA